ncbi:lactococcin 972 family bacteriocin [Corynebacterium sp. NPDC060344]|uniref:lactococcin 972 family bacteriocin n=1 Tax=Corynebacterium sp. NPDC060344 TaxID=3347101 RepID=UPI00364A8610
MKTTHLLAASLTVASLAIATPLASADTVSEVEYTVLTVDESGSPTSGMVSFPIDSTPSGAQIQKIPGLPGTNNESVGGGDWSYGWRLVNVTTKECFSNYMHRSKSHTATASMGGQHNSATARSGNWARALVRGGVGGGTCNVYWSTQ